MKAQVNYSKLQRPALASIALSVSAIACAANAQVAQQVTSEGKLRVIGSDAVASHHDGDSRSLQIVIKDGRVKVLRDGKEVPEAEIKQEDGQIIVLDKDGKRLQAFELRMHGGPESMGLWKGAGRNDLFRKSAEGVSPPKVMLGVHMTEPGAALESHLRLEAGQTTMIGGIYEGLPAYDAGLRQYDVIIEVNGETPADHATIQKAIASKDPGEEIEFTVIHEGKRKNVTVQLEAYDGEAMSKATLLGQPANPLWSYSFDRDKPFVVEGLPHFQELFVAPGEGQRSIQLYQPHIDSAMKELNEKLQQHRFGPDGVEEQLRRLDERMAELEAMLQKLLESKSGG